MAKDDMLQYMKKEDMENYIAKDDMLQYMKKEDMDRYVNQKIIHTIMFVSFIYLCWLYVYESLYPNNNNLSLAYK